MEIVSKIKQLSFKGNNKEDNKSKNEIIRPDFEAKERPEHSSLEALEQSGRAQVIKAPIKCTSQSVEEICDHFIKINDQYINGERKPRLNISAEEFERRNARLEIMKGLDSDKFLKRLSPNDYLYASKHCTADNEQIEKNVGVLNSLDDKVLDKIKPGFLYYILSRPDLDERAALLSETEDTILEQMSKDAVMDYLTGTTVFSDTAEDLELIKILPPFGDLPSDVQQDILDCKVYLDKEGLKEAPGIAGVKTEIIPIENKHKK